MIAVFVLLALVTILILSMFGFTLAFAIGFFSYGQGFHGGVFLFLACFLLLVILIIALEFVLHYEERR